MKGLALCRTGVAVALSLAFLFFSQAAMPETQAAPDLQAGGVPGPTAAGVRVDPGRIAPPIRGDTPGQERRVPRLYPVDPAAFGRLKAEANAAAAAKGTPPGSGTPPASGPIPSFPTLDFSQTGGWNPPDGAIAVGQSNILVAVNEAFAIYDKSSTSNVTPSGRTLFGDLFKTSDSTFDPRALYDNGHFVLLAVSQNGSTKTSRYQLAVSKSETAGSWCTYSLDAVTGSGSSAAWADFPGLGMDGTNLYITSNQFSFSSSSFQFARALAIPKTSVLPPDANGLCSAVATSNDYQRLLNPDGGYAFTVQPVNQSNYFVNALWSSGSQLIVRSLGSMDRPSAVNVAPYNLPADAPQPGFRAKAIDTGDDRLLGAMFANNKIYTGNNTRSVSSSLSKSPNAYSNAQWYAIDPSQMIGTTRAITNPKVAYFYPTVAALGNGNGSVGIGVSGSGPAQTASAFWTTSTSPATVTAFAGGVSSYSMASRWGDYGASAVDPSGSSVWVLGEYAKTTGGWGTAIAPVP